MQKYCFHRCTLFDYLVECGGSDRGNPRLTAVLAWVLLRVTMASRRFPRQGPRFSIVHGASAANATVVPMAYAVVVSMATAVELAMATHGSTTAIAMACSMATSTAIAAAIHGNQRQLPRYSTAITTAIHGTCHGNSHLNSHGNPLQSTAIATALSRQSTSIANALRQQ